jgi:hypothetical protein
VQDVSGASNLVGSLTSYESELIFLNGTVAGPLSSGGTGFAQANITTTGYPNADAGLPKFRAPEKMFRARDLALGCSFTLNGTPMWRFGSTANPTAWVDEELTNIAGCPAPRVMQAVATSPTTVVLTFDRAVKASSVTDLNQFPITHAPADGGVDSLAVSAVAGVSGTQVTLTTDTQTQGKSYKVTVAGTVTDNLDHGVDQTPPRNEATFAGVGLEDGGFGCNPAQVVVSQVYGGGGNTGAPYTHDFVELHNRSSTASVSLANWAIYRTFDTSAGATGSSAWRKQVLSGTLPPGGYFLIQAGPGASCDGGPCGALLPAPDLSVATAADWAMGATSGKILLSSDQSVAITGSCPTGSFVVDFVGYGLTANCAYASAPTLGPSNTTAAIRVQNGCQDTRSNGADFAIAEPTPRNGATTAVPCGCN